MTPSIRKKRLERLKKKLRDDDFRYLKIEKRRDLLAQIVPLLNFNDVYYSNVVPIADILGRPSFSVSMYESCLAQIDSIISQAIVELGLNITPAIYTTGASRPDMLRPVEVFFSYSHADEELKDHVRRQLAIFERLGEIVKWHDRMIPPGSDWRGQIDHRLNNAQVIILLISPHFLDSDYCYDVEMKTALERHEKRDATVIPVIARPCLWQQSPLGSIQALPKDAKPLEHIK